MTTNDDDPKARSRRRSGRRRKRPRYNLALLCGCSLVILVMMLEGCQAAKQRHGRSGRHRRVPEAMPAAAPAAENSFARSGSQEDNEHKPKIKNCKEAKDPEVEESSPKGTQVMQVIAEDLDGPHIPAGQITYSIVSRHKKFTIDKTTGWLSTNAMFNRDEPEREKTVYVTVKATDNGRPQLEDVCTLKVNIKDINDNSPVFDRSNYNVPVAQDTQVGTTIMQISATDVDEGVNQQINYELEALSVKSDIDYFQYNHETGVVQLKQRIDKPTGHNFLLLATASDGGNPRRSSEIKITLEVTESNNKLPTFVDGPGSIRLKEGYNDYSTPIAEYVAKSNVDGDDRVFFQLVNGRTEKTNKDQTFRAVQSTRDPSTVAIYLAKPLSYEKVNEYMLTLQVRNTPDLVAEAQLRIMLEDENNLAPIFINVESGSVLENESEGTIVMQVSADDKDGTYPNNKVTYSISKNNPKDIRDKFTINSDTGVVRTKQMFDREEQAVYAVTIDAEDGAPSSLLKNGQPNKTPNNFRIVIADKNDNPPYFPQQQYRADAPEDQDVLSKVIEVTAEDLDKEASVTTYQIIDGNIGDKFMIEEQTGFIRVKQPLDYEERKEYNLVVSAWDGTYGNRTNVKITILNVNDLKPVFSQKKYQIRQVEETLPPYPIMQVTAYDPDIGDRSKDQNITYYLDPGSQLAPYFSINKHTGDLRIVKKLDRDKPYGYPTREMFIYAKDEGGGPNGIESYVPFQIDLMDINDNAPFLNMPDGLVWPEGARPGRVGQLVADDYDAPENGPPYTFEIDPEKAPQDIKSWFDIEKLADGSYVLVAREIFDREKKKQFSIPVRICDHEEMCATSDLKLIIGDINDNPMAPGTSEIFVYNYEGLAPDTEIGRVYVQDPDDWDLPDKTFRFEEGWKWEKYFALNTDTGMITMRRGIEFEEGQDRRTFSVDFKVEDPVHDQVRSKAVRATVNITIQKISKEAVVKSGSMRIAGNPEDFVEPDANGFSKRDKFTTKMKQYLNATHFDVFTVIASPTSGNDAAGAGSSSSFTDVRFAAHGSPYYAPERLEGVLAGQKQDLARALGVDIMMIHIDECLREKEGKCKDQSCLNRLEIDNEPVSIYTNTSSFVGVRAVVVPKCECSAVSGTPTGSSQQSCYPNPCLNGGQCQLNPSAEAGYTCQCPANNSHLFGGNCQKVDVSFDGRGWSWNRGLPACGSSELSLVFKTQYDNPGTILYAGPFPDSRQPNLTDFLLLEVVDGKLKLHINFGEDTHVLELHQNIADNVDHDLSISWRDGVVKMDLDKHTCLDEVSSSQQNCFVELPNHGNRKYKFLNTNGPLQVGGISFGVDEFHKMARAQFKVKEEQLPHATGFVGCVKNLTFVSADERFLYDLGNPSDGENFTPRCDREVVSAVTAMRLDMNFLIVILVSVAILLIVIVVLAVCKKRKRIYNDKDIDCDIRENIINYEDEGGGEGDQTGYDLSVLRMMSDGSHPHTTLHAMHAADHPKMNGGKMAGVASPETAPDIQTFLQTNKDRIDGDPDATPFDDLRHYAYEGDGNSQGSLSSLNSGTSDGDLEFDYLHNFGPRFKKLADMYGEQPDSSDSSDEEGNANDLPPPPLPPPHSQQQQYSHIYGTTGAGVAGAPPSSTNSPHYYSSSMATSPHPGGAAGPPPPSESWC